MVSSIRRFRPTGHVGDLGALGRSVLPPLVVGLAVIIVVWPSLMPGVGYWDTGEFQTVAPILGTAHPTGYPTYVILGFLVNLLLTPLGEPAFRMNVFALLSVAVAAGAATWLTIRLSGSIPIGVAVGLGIATTPVGFAIATHADPHALHLAFVAVIFAVLVGWEQARRREAARADRWLVAAAVLFGLSAGNHSLTLLLAVPIGLYVLAVQPGILRRPRLVAICAAGLLGALVVVYLELPLRAGIFRAPLVYAHPESWDGFWYVALAEQFRGSLNDPLGELPRKAGELWTFATAQFGPLAPAIIVGFLATLVRHPRYALLSGSAMVITVLFNASYTNADITRYYLGPVLWAWTWLGVLLGVVVEQLKGAPAIEAVGTGPPDSEERAATPRPAWRLDLGRLDLVGLVSVVLAIALLTPTIADFGPRAVAAGRRDDTAARRWADSALAQVEPDAVVVSWWSTSTVLWYATLVDGQRTDVTIVDDRTRLDLDYGEATDVIARFLPTRPVYVIRANNHDLGLVLALYDLEPLAAPAANVYRVVSPRAAGS